MGKDKIAKKKAKAKIKAQKKGITTSEKWYQNPDWIRAIVAIIALIVTIIGIIYYK